MPGMEVKSVNLLGMPVPYAYAVKAGPWIFLTGHEAFDFASGIPEAVGDRRDIRCSEIAQPAGGRFHPAADAPDPAGIRLGSESGRAARPVLPKPEAVAAYHLARHAEFADYIPPSTSVVMERCFAAESTISTSLIAVVPSAGYEIRKIHPPGSPRRRLRALCRRWCATSSVFVAGQMAHNPRRGARPAGACAGAFGLGRDRDPQTDRVPDRARAD